MLLSSGEQLEYVHTVSFFHANMYEVGMGAEQGVFDDDFDPIIMACVWSSSFLLNYVSLSVGILSLRQEVKGSVGYSLGSLAEESPPLPKLRLHLRNRRFGDDIITIL